MSQPPKSTPHSDIEGVHRDEKPNVQSAIEAGQGTENLALAREEAAGRPDYAGDRPGSEPAAGPSAEEKGPPRSGGR